MKFDNDLAPAAMRPVLLVAYGGGHVTMLAPVALAMMDAGRPFVFLALTTAAAHLERLGIPSIGFRHLDEAQDPDVIAYGDMLSEGMPASGPVPLDETRAYLGLNYRELVREHGMPLAEEIYRERGRQAFFPVGVFRRLIERLKPALVVATNSPRSERASIAAARLAGVPALCAVDIFGLQEVQWIGVEGYADRVCVLNDQVRQMFISHGRRPEDIVVTGNPAFDRLSFPDTVRAGDHMRRTRGWDDGRTTLLWASQVEPERHPFADRSGDTSLPRRIETCLREFVASNDSFRLVVRYHPSQRELFEPQPRVEFSPTTEDLGALLHAVDVVVVLTSTVGLEASLVGRPVVSVDCSIFTEDAPYSRMGISEGVADVDQLPGALLAVHRRLQANAGESRALVTHATGSTATSKLMAIMDALVA